MPAQAEAQRLRYEAVAGEELAGEGAESGARSGSGAADEPRAVAEYYFDQMEYVAAPGADGYAFDLSASFGGERNRLYVAAIGEGTIGGSLDYLEMQAFYSRALNDEWDLHAGLRYDLRPVPNRAWLTLGAQGGPGDNLTLGAYAFLSHRGELAARFYGLYDIPLGRTGFILQPSAEANLFAQDIAPLGLGRGLAFGEAGLRLRYVVKHDWLAPYVGVEWQRSFGRTARFTRDAGDDVSGRVFLIGVRSWF